MSQTELACVGKFVIALIGYFLGTGLAGALLSGDNGPEYIPTVAWVIGGLAFAILTLFV